MYSQWVLVPEIFENGCENFCAFVALSWRGIDGSLSMLGVAGFGSLFQNCYRRLFCQRTGRLKYLPVFLSEPWVEWCIGVPVGVSRSVKISEMRSVIFGLSLFRVYLRLVDWGSLVKMGGSRWRRMLYGRLEYMSECRSTILACVGLPQIGMWR